MERQRPSLNHPSDNEHSPPCARNVAETIWFPFGTFALGLSFDPTYQMGPSQLLNHLLASWNLKQPSAFLRRLGV